MGWEPREFIEYVYEGGVLVGSVRHREPEFDDRDRALLLAHHRAAGDMGPHGQPMSEATSPEADPARPGGWRYEANTAPRMDWAAKAVGDRQDAYYKNRPEGESRNGHRWYAKRVEN